MNIKRRQFIGLFSSLAAVSSHSLFADEPTLVEPVHRVANATAASIEPTPVPPINRALDIARSGLVDCQKNLNDYTALLVKRERIDGVLGTHEFAMAKIRNRKVVDGKIVYGCQHHEHLDTAGNHIHPVKIAVERGVQ